MSLTPRSPYHVYILWTDVGRHFYIGTTDDVPRRFTQHNSGESKWTKRHAGSWELVWRREFASLGEARKFESRLKRQKRGRGFWTFTGLDPADFASSSSGS